jgi:hypothetical protein
MPALTGGATKSVAVSSLFIIRHGTQRREEFLVQAPNDDRLFVLSTYGEILPQTDHHTAGERLRGGRTIRLSSAESTRAQTKEINDDV